MGTLVTLPNLYTSPQDIFDLVGIDAVQLREDDKNLASGQQIATTVAASLGDTSLTIAALSYPLLKGTVVVFAEAAMNPPVEVTLSAVATAGATTLSVVALGADIPAGAIATDNGVNVWLAALMAKGCKYATAKIKSYCCGRYDDSALAQSWSVNNWATIIAARWISSRRFQSVPQGIDAQYQETLEELKAVKIGNLNIEDIGTRTSGWPFISNVSIDLGYTIRKVRVEPQISEPTPTQYPQCVDYSSVFLFGSEW